MKTLKDYSLIELIGKYKKYITKDIETLAYVCSFNYDEKERIIFEATKDLDPALLNSIDSAVEMAFQFVCASIFLRGDINNDIGVKRRFLAKIHYMIGEELDEKDEKELSTLLLDGKKCANVEFEIYDENGDMLNNFIILTKESKRTIDDIKNEKVRRLVSTAFDYMGIDDIERIIQKKYSKEFYSSLIGKFGVEYLVLKKGFTLKQVKELFAVSDEKISDEMAKEFIGIIRNNLQLVDINDVLMVVAAKTVLGIKLKMGERLGDARLFSEKR